MLRITTSRPWWTAAPRSRSPSLCASDGEAAPASARRACTGGGIPGRRASPPISPASMSGSPAPILRSRKTRKSANAKRLFFDSVDCAERTIVIENQYLTATRFAGRVAKRMLEKPELEVLIIAPKHAHSWLEEQTMHAGLGRFMRLFADAGVSERVALLHPQVSEGGKHCRCHDPFQGHGRRRRFAADRIGKPEQPLFRSRYRVRSCLRGENAGPACGNRSRPQSHARPLLRYPAEEVAASLSRTGSLIAAARSLRCGGHSLEPIDLAGAQNGPAIGAGDRRRSRAPDRPAGIFAELRR